MNKRDAKRDSCSMVAVLIESYLSVGQPMSEHGCVDDCRECANKVAALEQLRDELERRGNR